MKRTIKHITLAVIIATATTGAHAAWTDTVKGYWKSACAKATTAAHAVQAMPGSVSNWCANAYFFSKNKLHIILTKIDAGTASKEECEALADAIRASTLPAHEKNVLVSTLKRHTQKQSVTREEILNVSNALISIENATVDSFGKIGAATVITAAGIAAVYAYKRLTTRPAIPGWCA